MGKDDRQGRVIVGAVADHAPDRCARKVGHVPHHGGSHPLGIGLFALEIGDHGAFSLSRDEMDVDGHRLTETPEPANGLEYLLEAIVEPDEPGIAAMLPVHAEPCQRCPKKRFADPAPLFRVPHQSE